MLLSDSVLTFSFDENPSPGLTLMVGRCPLSSRELRERHDRAIVIAPVLLHLLVPLVRGDEIDVFGRLFVVLVHERDPLVEPFAHLLEQRHGLSAARFVLRLLGGQLLARRHDDIHPYLCPEAFGIVFIGFFLPSGFFIATPM